MSKKRCNFVYLNKMDWIYSYISTPWFYWTITIAYSVTVLCIVGIIVSENRNPLKSLAWVTVLLLFPIGGILLYVFFGRNIRNIHIISRRNKRRLLNRDSTRSSDGEIKHLSADNRQLSAIAKSLGGSGLYVGNEIEIFDNGRDKFEALIADIGNARRFINLQYYIFEDDTIGTRVADALIERANAGVKVRVIYDHIGSIHVKNAFFRRMRDAGISIYPFFRVAFPIFGSRINWRNHRKLTIIDGTTGYIGGMNIADRYITGGKFHRWRDLHIRIKGPAVESLQYSFALDWNFMGQPLIEDNLPELPSHDSTHNGSGLQMITSGPASRWSNIAMVFIKAISTARKRVYIQTPYFLPTESLLKTLQAAALSHVDVRIMIPRHSDSIIMTNASYSFISECLRAGIKIYLYNGGMLHSKMMLVDYDWATVGSTNFDFRSFEHNFEGNMLIYSTEINHRLAKIFQRDLEDSERVKPAAWRKRPIWQKTKESIVRLLSPIL